MFTALITKPKKVFIIGGLVLFFCLANILGSSAFAMGKRKKKKTIIQGRVTEQINSVTEVPVPGVNIKILELKTHKEVASVVSGLNGAYKLTTTLNGYFDIKASAENYSEDLQQYKYFKKGNTYPVNFKVRLLKNTPPQITSFIPKEHLICIMGDSLNFSISAIDKNNDSLVYRYLMDGEVIRDWSGSSGCIFKVLTSYNSGKHKITVEVKDYRDGLDSKSVEVYIVRAFPKP